MSNYSALKTDINNNIYENNTQQITGTVLNTVLKDMVNTLGAGYQFAGCAYLDLNPGAPDAKVFYLAGEGLYTNFDNIQVPAGKLGILKWDTRWRLETIEGLGGGGANLTGYISVASTDDLPDEGQPTIGYLCGTNLYLYVGEGGDTKEGKYQNCGGFRGPEGVGITEIEQVEQSTANGGRNTIRIHLSNGSSYDVYTRNGTTSTGLFPTLEALQAAYPSPVVGQYAFVGAGFPADIYVCNTAGTWTDSGADYDGDNVDLTDYATKAELNQLEAKVDGVDGNYLENMAVTQNDRTPVSAEGFGVSDFIPYTQGNSVFWKWGANTNMKSLCFYDSDKQPITNGYWNGDAAGGQRTITASDINRYAPTAAYIRASFVLTYKDVATVTTGDVVWTPTDAVPGLTPRVSALEQAVENQQGEIEELEQTIDALDLDKIYSGQEANYENGRIGAGGNIYKDSYSEGWYIPKDFIPCSPGDVLTWTSGENNGNGRKCLCLYDENKVFVPNGYWQPSQQPKTISITSEYSTARYVRFCFKLKKADTTDNTTPLLINGAVAFEVQNYIPGLTPTDEKATEALNKVNQLLPTDTEHGIIGENYPSEVLVVENQLQAKLTNRFHFIHISDNHGASFGYAQEYLDLSPAKFLINTGDLVADKFADKDLASFQTITLATEPTKPVYLALGNHDYSHATSRQAVFDAFIAPTNTHNGTAFDKTYYSIDFSTEKVKCIVLDMNDGWADAELPNYGPSGNLTWGKMSQTQINWLATQLQDAITNSLDIVIFIHTPPAQVSRFNRIKDFSDTINLDYARNLTFLPGLIDAFINGETASFTYDGNNYSFTFASGGHFVSWVCGHEHGDLCGWMDGHENQFIAVVCRPYRDTSVYGGSYDGDKLGVHWNYCTIDTGRKSFAVYRMGQQTTIFGTDRVSFRILYK